MPSLEYLPPLPAPDDNLTASLSLKNTLHPATGQIDRQSLGGDTCSLLLLCSTAYNQCTSAATHPSSSQTVLVLPKVTY